MKNLLLIFSFFIYWSHCYGQNDTINQKDETGRKQGHWIYYGKDRPDRGYPADGKIEEGPYKDNRKEGLWIKYHRDGKTPKLKGVYHNNRPSGQYWKYNERGMVLDSGVFNRSSSHISRGRSLQEKNVFRDTMPISYQVDTANITTVSQEKAPTIRGCVTGSGFKPNGYNKVYNENDEVWQDGEFRNSRLYNGKVYIYDEDGILLKVRLYKNGIYHSDGQL